MKALFEEYGGPIIAAVVIGLLVTIIYFMMNAKIMTFPSDGTFGALGGQKTSVVNYYFQSMINNFFNKANASMADGDTNGGAAGTIIMGALAH